MIFKATLVRTEPRPAAARVNEAMGRRYNVLGR
jgi:hypothetical protein